MLQDWDQTRRHGSCVLLPPWYFFRQIVVDLQIRADNAAWVQAAPYRNVISLKLSFRSIYDEILASLDAIVRTETSPHFQIWILQILLFSRKCYVVERDKYIEVLGLRSPPTAVPESTVFA